MRYFIALFLLSISTFSSGQTELLDAKKIWSRDSIRLGTNWIRSISKDTALLTVTDRDIPSTKAVKDFVLNRWNNGLVPWDNITGKPSLLISGNNLADVSNVATARTNLSVYSIATVNDSLLNHYTKSQADARFKGIDWFPSVANVTGLPDSLTNLQARIQSKLTKSDADTYYPSIQRMQDSLAAVQARVQTKEPFISPGTSAQYWRGDKSWQTLDKSAVGLSAVPNVDATNPANISQSATYRFVTDSEKSTWNAKQNALGYTPENTANKATDFSTVNNTLYPTVQAVSNAITSATSSYIPLSQKGANNGVATLDVGGKVPFSQLPAALMIYKGTWNVSTNTPTLADGTGVTGWVYIVSVGGTINTGSGNITYSAGDYAIHNGSTWEKSAGTNNVASVNGQQGVVNLTTANISESGNLYYTDARTRAALSFTPGSGGYNSSTGVITIPTNTSQLTNGAGFITGYTETDPTIYAWAKAASKPSYSWGEITGTVPTWNQNTTGNAATASFLIGQGSSITSQVGAPGAVYYNFAITYPQSGLFPAVDNSNSILTLNRHPGDYYSQLGFSSNGNLYYRRYASAAIETTLAWQTILSSENYNNYSPSLTGGGASGTWGINVTGNSNNITQYTINQNLGTSNSPTFTNGTYTGNLTANSLIKSGSSDSYLLLGGGGHILASTYATAASISGTINNIPKYTASGAIGNSILQEGSSSIGISVTPSAWATVTPALEFTAGGFIASQGSANTLYIGSNHYYNGTNFIRKQVGHAMQYQVGADVGAFVWKGAASGSAGSTITFTDLLTLNSSSLTSTVPINGTALIMSGAGSFGANTTITGSDRVLTLRGAGGGANSLVRYSDATTAKYSTGFNGGNYIIYDDANSSYVLSANTTLSQFTGAVSSTANSIVTTLGYNTSVGLASLNPTLNGTSLVNNTFISGKAASTNNAATIIYSHTSDGNTLNQLGFGFWSNDNLFTLNATGSLGFKNGVWHKSDGGNRFFFNDDTYIGIKSGGTWYFQNGSASNVVTITSAGAIISNSSISASSTITGSVFYGAGTGLTGNANGLSVGSSLRNASGELTDLNSFWSGSTVHNGFDFYRYNSSATNRPNAPDNANWVMNLYSHTGGYGAQIAGNNAAELHYRTRNGVSFGSWVQILHGGNYNNYSPSLTGSGASGTWAINVTGNANNITQYTVNQNLGTGNSPTFVNGTYTGNITANALIKSGSSDSYFLLGGGGHVLASTYATAASLSGYVDISSNQYEIGGNKTFLADVVVNGKLTGARILGNTATYTTTATISSGITTAFCSNSSGSNYTLTMPSASGVTGQIMTVILTSGTLANTVTLSGINGGSYVLSCHASVVLVSDGTNWKIASVYNNTAPCS